jgi:hypothetical protein
MVNYGFSMCRVRPRRGWTSSICRSSSTTNCRRARRERRGFAQFERNYTLNALVSLLVYCFMSIRYLNVVILHCRRTDSPNYNQLR